VDQNNFNGKKFLMIRQYTKDLDFKSFQSGPKTVDAVVRNLAIIGEAARHVPECITEKRSDIPWQEMRDMRNLLSHEYFGVNVKIMWETIQSDLPPLEHRLKMLLP
jgi:uncharacterized protein with HEPN domain